MVIKTNYYLQTKSKEETKYAWRNHFSSSSLTAIKRLYKRISGSQKRILMTKDIHLEKVIKVKK